MDSKIRVLIVDDSFMMRKIITDIISSDSRLEVIYSAKEGKEAIEKIALLKPDVVTLDVNLPQMHGLAVLNEIMKVQPTRVIMCSAHTRQGAASTISALEAGAVDFVAKPSGEISLDLATLKDELILKIKLAAEISLDKLTATVKTVDVSEPVFKPESNDVKKIVIIGASTGGPKAVLQIMKNLSADTPAAFLIIQHMPKGFTSSFAERISESSNFKAKEAEEGNVISQGSAYVAPAGSHMLLEKCLVGQLNQLKLRITQDPPVNYLRPSITVTMNSAVEAFAPNLIGVILTGMGKDGLEGVRLIKEQGGLVIAQDESTSVIWGMPKVVAEGGLADEVLPLSEIPNAITKNLER